MEFQTFREGETYPQLIFKDQEGQERVMSADTVIGADGIHSRVGREAGLLQPPSVPLLQAEIDLPAAWDPALTKVWFDLERTRYFFWLIPESEERGVVGLIGNPGSDLREILDDFLASLEIQADGYQAGQAAMHHPRLRPEGRVGNSRVLLVGDAAGQVKVTTVGGTVTGLWGAQAAAEAVSTGEDYLDLLQPLERELDLHWWIRALLERMEQDDYRKMIKRLSSPVTDFLARHDRDSMKSRFWKLPFLQPLFIPLGLKLLFRKARFPTLLPGSRGRRRRS
jgi:flavin-dependent dehydrogenase